MDRLRLLILPKSRLILVNSKNKRSYVILFKRSKGVPYRYALKAVFTRDLSLIRIV